MHVQSRSSYLLPHSTATAATATATAPAAATANCMASWRPLLCEEDIRDDSDDDDGDDGDDDDDDDVLVTSS